MLESILIAVSLTLLYWVWRGRQSASLREAKFPPGPLRLPLIHSLWDLAGLDNKGTLKRMEHYLAKYGSTVYFGLGPIAEHGCVVTEPEHLKIMLTSRVAINKPEIFYSRISFLNNGLISTSGSQWQHHRRALEPAFSTKILNGFTDKLSEFAEKFCDLMKLQRADKGFFKCETAFCRHTVTSLIETIFGLDSSKVDPEDTSTFVDLSLHEICIVTRRFVQFYSDFIYNMTSDGKATKKGMKFLNEYALKLVKLYDEKVAREKETGESNDDETRTIFLDKARHFPEEDLIGEMRTALLAGSLSTALACAYTLALLSLNPECQDKVHEEIAQVMGDSDRRIDAEDLKKMDYLDACLKESMRLFPPAPVMLRKLTGKLQLGEYVLPEGSMLYGMPYKTHRMPEHWDTPDKFNPLHFSPEAVKKRHPYAYMPFSTGPRNCIGWRYAFMNAKITLAAVLRRYRVTTDNKMSELQVSRMLTLEGNHLSIALHTK